MTRVARMRCDCGQATPRTLQDMEDQTVRMRHALGTRRLTALLPLAAPVRPAPDVPCPCDHTARQARIRPATVTAVLGRVTVERAIAHCASWGDAHAPLDAQLPFAAGGLSLGRQEWLALPETAQDSFAQAATVRERLGLAPVGPKSVRAAAADLGAARAAHDQQAVTTAQTSGAPPLAEQSARARVHLSTDGGVAPVHGAGWKAINTGAVSATRTRVPQQRPEQLVMQTEQPRALAARTAAATVGWPRWAAAGRRSVTAPPDRVVSSAATPCGVGRSLRR